MEGQRDRGAVIVEFAIIAPLLIMLIVGVVEFGRLLNVQIALQGATREGARAGALRKTSQEVSTAVRAAAPSTRVDRIVLQSVCPTTGDGTATVRAETDVVMSIPLVPIGTITVKASSSMRCGL